MAKNKDPQRRCIQSGQTYPKEQLVRFVIGPDSAVVPDIAERLPGRGLWLCARRDMIEKACASGTFSKAARAKVDMPGDLINQVEDLLRRKCLEIIGLARRSGQMIGGFEKVKAHLSAGMKDRRAGLLIAARDGSEESRRKISALAPGVPLIKLFSGKELGAAVGRERLVHAVIEPGGFADRLISETDRLSGLAG